MQPKGDMARGTREAARKRGADQPELVMAHPASDVEIGRPPPNIGSETMMDQPARPYHPVMTILLLVAPVLTHCSADVEPVLNLSSSFRRYPKVQPVTFHGNYQF